MLLMYSIKQVLILEVACQCHCGQRPGWEVGVAPWRYRGETGFHSLWPPAGSEEGGEECPLLFTVQEGPVLAPSQFAVIIQWSGCSAVTEEHAGDMVQGHSVGHGDGQGVGTHIGHSEGQGIGRV